MIGTLAANGIAPRALRRHYRSYGLIAGAAAVLPGVVLGVVLGRWLTTMYTDALGLPLHVASLHFDTIAIAGRVTLDALWHAVPAFPTVSEVWLRFLEAYGL